MITNVELTEAGVAKFNKFFADFAGEKLDMQATMFELLDVLQECACRQEDFVYELGRQYTNTGRPEILSLDASDVSVTEEDDE